MLIPIQASGRKLPLFFVHGIQGLMPLGSVFARALGPDQPLFVIHADGTDGRRPVIDNMGDMVRAYVEEIERASPVGPVRVGGMCTGCFIAMEIVRSLQKKGRQTGPVILADPPSIPSGQTAHRRIDHRQPQIAHQLYEQARLEMLRHASLPYNAMPFDPGDPKQLHAAALAAVGSLIASSTYVPTPFPGPVQLIVSAKRAPSFFHPQMPWRKLLTGPRFVHVLPWDHMELFREGREAVARLLRFMLEEAATLETLAERRADRTVA
jgi:thioesterase domain-containing protein